ncbi:hypothetical protein AGMMS50262_03190 [Bacteroidia bacterium]|nr:hypothetical protein AGMMS50262_03190 [Bacteroidia bacterium]
MYRKLLYRIVTGIYFLVYPVFLFSQNPLNKADSIIAEALKHRDLYGKYIQEYDAQMYIKGSTHVMKKNKLSKFAPDFLYLDKKRNNSFVEALVDVHYTRPHFFTQKIEALNGNKLHAGDIRDRVMPFLNSNIYSSTIFNNQVVMPGIRDVFNYYRFEYVSTKDTLDKKIHHIRIIPKIRSQKLVSGYIDIVDEMGNISHLDLWGTWEFFDFRMETDFGLEKKNFLLPLTTTLTFHLKLLGNETESRYYSQYEYHEIKLNNWENKKPKTDYDLSEYFTVQSDSIPFIRDTLFWQKNRPVPLSPYEASLIDAEKTVQKPDNATIVGGQSLTQATQGLIIPKKFSYNDTQFSYSGLINPLKISYSKLDGIVYWQQLKLHKQFPNGREFQFQPDLGILFQRKEVYFRIPVSWLFASKKFGKIYYNFGNRNQAFSSKTIDEINKKMQGNIDFDDLDLKYYRHLYMELKAQYEITNGLILNGGWDYDWYIPVKEKEGNSKSPLRSMPSEINDDVIDLVLNQYRSAAPVIGLTWTPGQFYCIHREKKEYISSHFPTFSIEYARGIRGIFESNSHYERIEMDIQQKIPLGLLRSFHYYIGAGCFTNTQSVYFADFKNFQRRNIPLSWNDPIGGTFHLLSSEWYNASDKYLQSHFMYESPFFILRFFKGLAKDIVKERIYVSQLYTPVHPCYTEIGYGVGNFLLNAGIFVSLNKGKYEGIGAKFAFELGR